jgi:hypothetical protein
MVFHALRSSHKIYFLAVFLIADDSQLFFLMNIGTYVWSFLGSVG